MDDMADIKSLDLLVDHESCEDVLVCMWADVEVARDLLDSEWTHESTSIVFLECLFGHLVLFHLIWLSQQFKIGAIKSLSYRVETVFLDGGYVYYTNKYRYCHNVRAWYLAYRGIWLRRGSEGIQCLNWFLFYLLYNYLISFLVTRSSSKIVALRCGYR